jgi:hypothetical protein
MYVSCLIRLGEYSSLHGEEKQLGAKAVTTCASRGWAYTDSDARPVVTAMVPGRRVVEQDDQGITAAKRQ